MALEDLGWIGLKTALESKSDTIILIDGDEPAKGMVSVGDPAVVTPGDLQALIDAGIKKIVLGFEEQKYIDRVIDYAYRLVVPPEVLVDSGGGGWHSAHTWQAYTFIDRFEDKEELVNAVIRFDESITNPIRIAHMALQFWPVIEEHLGPLEQPIGELYQAYRHNVTIKKSNDIIRNASKMADELARQGSFEEAKFVLFDGYSESEALTRLSKLKPVRTLNEMLDDHEADVVQYRDRDILGLKTDMKELTDGLLGLRGLIFLGGPPNLGKTVLATQLAIQVLQNQPDTCVVYMNLDMDTNDLLTRIRCYVGGFEWKEFVRGHNVPIKTGRKEVEVFGDRLVVLDHTNFTGNIEDAIAVGNETKKRTGCTRIMYVLDYLQRLRVPDALRKVLRTDMDKDEWQVEAAQQLKSSIHRHDAVICISEIRKEAYDRVLAPEDLKGSSRLSYAADIVLLLQGPTVDEFCSHFDPEGVAITVWWPHKRDIESIDKKTKESMAPKIKERLQQDSIAVGYLAIGKGRDGTVRKRIAITSHFKTATIVEGFHIDGLPKEQVRGETNELESIFTEGVDEGTVQGDTDQRKGYFWQD
jgi:replicative DNA helicase